MMVATYQIYFMPDLCDAVAVWGAVDALPNIVLGSEGVAPGRGGVLLLPLCYDQRICVLVVVVIVIVHTAIRDVELDVLTLFQAAEQPGVARSVVTCEIGRIGTISMFSDPPKLLQNLFYAGSVVFLCREAAEGQLRHAVHHISVLRIVSSRFNVEVHL